MFLFVTIHVMKCLIDLIGACDIIILYALLYRLFLILIIYNNRSAIILCLVYWYYLVYCTGNDVYWFIVWFYNCCTVLYLYWWFNVCNVQLYKYCYNIMKLCSIFKNIYTYRFCIMLYWYIVLFCNMFIL